MGTHSKTAQEALHPDFRAKVGPDGEWDVLEVNAVPGWRALEPVTGVLGAFPAGPSSFSFAGAPESPDAAPARRLSFDTQPSQFGLGEAAQGGAAGIVSRAMVK